jgi:hypothetical protein
LTRRAKTQRHRLPECGKDSDVDKQLSTLDKTKTDSGLVAVSEASGSGGLVAVALGFCNHHCKSQIV